MKHAALLIALILAPVIAEADPLELTIEPATCREGRPLQIRLSVKSVSDKPQAVLWLEAKVTDSVEGHGVSSRQGWGQQLSGVSMPHLGPDLVTLDLIASEDLGNSAVARAPRPDVRATLQGTPHVLCRFLAPGETLTRTITVVPHLPGADAQLGWEAIPLDPLSAKGKVFVRKQGHSWTPGSEGQAPGLRPSPSSSRSGLRVELMRWEPWTGKKTREVLIERAAFQSMARTKTSASAKLRVEPAKFGLTVAQAKAEIEGETTSVRLKDDRWILEQKGRWCIVGPQGPVTRGEGKLFPFALDLARSGRAGFMWYAYPDHPELAQALAAGGFGKDQGKGMPIEVTEKSLVPFLKLLSKHGVRLSENGISKP